MTPKRTIEKVTLDPPLITALVSDGREKRRDVPLSVIPPLMVQAVLAIEDRRFYDHFGIDPIGIASAPFDNVFGKQEVSARRQHPHAAAGQEHIPDAGTDAQTQSSPSGSCRSRSSGG